MTTDCWPMTSRTLLHNMVHASTRSQRDEAWTEFVRRYTPPIERWWWRWRGKLGTIQTREDFCQIILVKLFRAMQLADVRRWIKKLLLKCMNELGAAAVSAGPGSPE